MKEAANRGGATMSWIGGIFVAALIAIALAIYSDVALTRCQPKTFAAVTGLCTVVPR
jgi:hypothetical protein